MRIDVVSIFPEYFQPLELSLVGKARAAGLIDIRLHDLRNWTHDRHRTVDDTPYGGGAGMVMNPVVWGEALDSLLGMSNQDQANHGGQSPDRDQSDNVVANQAAPSTLLFTTPAGHLFNQATAASLAQSHHLVIACGRYEGIDGRVVAHYANRTDVIVREISIGDYVLAGGEVAALVMVEAITRLLPGVLGNAASLTEESHLNGLLEYPVYTKPAVWRGLAVPSVLLSGHHAAITNWHNAQALARTQTVRPDLLDGTTPPDC